ncbi:MAG: hypothetical protein A2V90_05865 [Gammaproteobacteria bacterium RBG_16_57_12]|nr:MAG: hypothetical protein A2V90_05865 [Gammaproteobacteria bacterium RBG_16_57_12]
MINVLIVDDHSLVRSGIARILNDVPDIKVVGEAESGEDALRQVSLIRPDVVLMDANMPGIGGLEASRKLLHNHPDIKILVVTVYGDGPIPMRFLEAGVSGYLTKGCSAEEIVTAVMEVYAGRHYLGREVSQHLAMSMVTGIPENPFSKLSQRELQVMIMVIHGYKISEISDSLCLSPKTISTYRCRSFEKLGVRNDAMLAKLALEYGLVDTVPQQAPTPAQ